MKVLCSKNTLICEIYEDGLYIHLIHDVDDLAVLDILDGMPTKVYEYPGIEKFAVGVFVYPESVVEALVELSSVFDLVVQ